MSLTTLSELKKSFNSALENTSDKQFLIENELREINNFINYVPIPKPKKGLIVRYYQRPKGTGIFELDITPGGLFTEAFNSILITGDYEMREKSFHEPIEAFEIRQEIVKQASEFTEYYKWLNSLKNSPQKVIRKNDLTHG